MNIVIVGSAGHAKVIIDIVEKEQRFELIGLIDSTRQLGETTLRYPVLGSEEDLNRLCKDESIEGGLIAIGDNWQRHLVAEKISSMIPDFRFVTAIHPSAQIGRNVEIARGTVIAAGAVVNPDSRIGAFCIVNTNSSLDHDCEMRDFSSLAPGVAVAGKVTVGEFSAICLDAAVGNGVVIGAHTVVGAGSVVLKDIPSHALAFGIPARVVRTREGGERYL